MNDSNIPFKTCPKCGTAYPAAVEFFNRNKNCADGFNVWCKACMKAWREANRETLLEKKRAYYEAHKDDEEFKRCKAESKKWYVAENREYRAPYREERREYDWLFRATHPDYHREYNRRWYRIPLCHGRGGCNNFKHDKMPEKWLIERFGEVKAREVLPRINAYFEWVKNQETY